MSTATNTASAAQRALLALTGWQPQHRALEAEAAELADVMERDAAARQTFAGREAR
jgi:hypothetical protein